MTDTPEYRKRATHDSVSTPAPDWLAEMFSVREGGGQRGL